MSKIKTALEKIFNDYRIVFWYDAKEELDNEFNELELDNVEKIVVDNNEFSLKYRMMREEPTKKFLLYFQKEKPSDLENWLLDLNISGYEFYTDQSSLYLQELELPQEFKPMVLEHLEFFKSKKRIEKLKNVLEKEDRRKTVKQKMLSVICNTENKMTIILLSLFAELAKGGNEKFNLLTKCNLDNFFWEEIERNFRYKSETPTLLDFAIELYKANYNYYSDKRFNLSQEAIVLLSRWMDSSQYKKYFEILANKLEVELKIKEELESVDYKTLIKTNVFQVVEQKIIAGLKSDIISNTIKHSEVKEIIQLRSDRYWYGNYRFIYNSINYAIEFFNLVSKTKFNFSTLEEGFNSYTTKYYKIDYYYRKFLYEYQRSNNSPILCDLLEMVEKQYSNNYLLSLNDKWQTLVDSSNKWNIPGEIFQKDFYRTYVQPYLDKGQRIFVIISDALRYEIGEELLSRILEEKRFHASIKSMFTTLPSYTELGMSALLPHENISYKENSQDVLVDGISSSGTQGRDKILKRNNKDSIAIRSDNFLQLNSKTDGRELAKKHSVIYIYSNIIDDIGDDKDTEVKVIKAIDDEIENIIRILKHIVNCNGNHALITSDHGFIYQNRKLDESDFSEINRYGEIYKSNRRFVIGKDLSEEPSVKKYIADELSLDGNNEFLITKSINRLRVKGSGSRFVHGGASLQEIAIPVIEFSKKRDGDIVSVDVDVIRNFSKITSNQITVSLYQVNKVEEKVQPRELRLGIYSSDGNLLSDQPTYNFNSTEDEANLREKKHRFSFIKDVNQYNGQTIYLKMEEKIPNTNQFVEYKKISYTLQISFTGDFDDF